MPLRATGKVYRYRANIIAEATCSEVLEALSGFDAKWMLEGIGRVVEHKKTRKGVKAVLSIGPPGVQQTRYSIEVQVKPIENGVSYRVKGAIDGELRVEAKQTEEGSCRLSIEATFNGGNALDKIMMVNPDAHAKMVNRVVSAIMSRFQVAPEKSIVEKHRADIRDVLSLLTMIHGAPATGAPARIRGIVVDMDTGEVKGYEGVDKSVAEKLAPALAASVKRLMEAFKQAGLGGFERLVARTVNYIVVVDVEDSTIIATLLKSG